MNKREISNLATIEIIALVLIDLKAFDYLYESCDMPDFNLQNSLEVALAATTRIETRARGISACKEIFQAIQRNEDDNFSLQAAIIKNSTDGKSKI